jgi:hypothetical protein
MNLLQYYFKFDHLDTNVQEEFERYLDERGIGGDLALFVPDYAEYKEQKVGPEPQSSNRLRRPDATLHLLHRCRNMSNGYRTSNHSSTSKLHLV